MKKPKIFPLLRGRQFLTKGQGVGKLSKKTKMNRYLRRRFSWSDLPPELIEAIADRLNSDAGDVLHLRAVCKNWRSSVPPPFLCLNPCLPHRILYVSDPLPFNDSGRPFLVVSTAVYLLRRRLFAVEQSVSGKVRLVHPLTRTLVENLPIRFLKIHKLSAMEISRGFNLRFLDGMTPVLQRKPKSFCTNKVVFWPNPEQEPPDIGDSSLMVLHNTGNLYCVRLGNFKDRCSIAFQSFSKFDDMVYWKGFMFAVDRYGRLFGIQYNTMKVVTVLVTIGNSKGPYDEKRKRLLISDGKMYLVVRDSTTRCLNFKVYMLNEKKHMWEELLSLGDLVLFISFDTCFFIQARDLLPGFRGNCIVYPKGCFPSYTSQCNPDDNMFQIVDGHSEVGVHNYGEEGSFKLVSSCPEFPNVFPPHPTWIWEDTAISHGEYENEEKQMDFPGQQAPVVSCSRATPASEVQGTKRTGNPCIPSFGLAAEKQSKEYSSTTDDQKHVYREDIRDTSMQDFKLDFASISPSNDGASTVKFQGVDVRSDLAPVLQKIWAKRGDITKGSIVSHRGILAGALESLARAVLILLHNSASSLKDSQAHDLSCIMHDLQNIHFNVDWLVPFVEKAFQRHNSKPMLEVLVELEKAKSKVEEMRKKLLGLQSEMHHTVEGLEDNRRLVSATVDAMGLDEWLGEGLI